MAALSRSSLVHSISEGAIDRSTIGRISSTRGVPPRVSAETLQTQTAHATSSALDKNLSVYTRKDGRLILNILFLYLAILSFGTGILVMVVPSFSILWTLMVFAGTLGKLLSYGRFLSSVFSSIHKYKTANIKVMPPRGIRAPPPSTIELPLSRRTSTHPVADDMAMMHGALPEEPEDSNATISVNAPGRSASPEHISDSTDIADADRPADIDMQTFQAPRKRRTFDTTEYEGPPRRHPRREDTEATVGLQLSNTR